MEGLDLSFILITQNEADNLPDCLASLPNGCEIIVVDSGSQDASKEIAKQFGAKVFDRDFDDFASQRNFALSHSSKTWVFSIDADERLNSALRNDLSKIISQGRAKAYRVRRQLVFLGRRMRYGKSTDYPTRLFRRDGAQFESRIHEKLNVMEEKCATLPTEYGLEHRSYRDLRDYFERFNRYTSLVAENHFLNKKKKPGLVRHLLRPWWEFVTRYFLRLGFLDGYAGYTYALLSSLYSYVKYAKLYEMEVKRS